MKLSESSCFRTMIWWTPIVVVGVILLKRGRKINKYQYCKYQYCCPICVMDLIIYNIHFDMDRYSYSVHVLNVRTTKSTGQELYQNILIQYQRFFSTQYIIVQYNSFLSTYQYISVQFKRFVSIQYIMVQYESFIGTYIPVQYQRFLSIKYSKGALLVQSIYQYCKEAL